MNIQTILDAKGGAPVFTIEESASLSEFVREACLKEVGAMLVTDQQEELSGIITERDILQELNAGTDFQTARVGEVMSRNLVTVQAEDDIQTAMDYLITLKLRHIPVLSGKDVAGVITPRDILLALRRADAEETRALVDLIKKSPEMPEESAEETAPPE